MEIKQVNSKLEPCCADETNRVLVKSWPTQGIHMGQPATGTAFHQQCKVCGRNHRGIIVDSVKIGVKGC